MTSHAASFPLQSASPVGAAVARGNPFGDKRLLSDLLVASAHQDEAAFSRFYQLTSPWIYLLLRRWTGSTTAAEDATVAVYTTIWRRASSFVPRQQSALAWATNIAHDLVAA